MPGDSTWWDALFKELLDTKFNTIDERFAALNKALELQAREYSRRLEDLNHAHARAVEVQSTFVSIDKYEAATQAEERARKLALDRLDEKLEEYILRYEIRQREIDQALAIGEGASREAQRIAEEQGRKTNRNMAILGVVVAIVVAVSNYIGA